MATFTSLGVGSGLDLNTIVTKLVALERQPLDQMKKDANALQTRVSSFGQINSLMSGLQTAAQGLTNPLLWSQSTVNSSDASVVSVSSGTNVAAGNYAVTVQQLAASQTLASGSAYSSSGARVGAGTLTLQLGSWNADQSEFSARTGSNAIGIRVSAADTVQTLADKINGAGAGVTATLITDTSGVRLSLSSSNTGAANGFRLTAAEAQDAPGLSIVAFDPPNGATAMKLMQGSSDAKATVNGIAVTSESNAVTGVVSGVTFNLNKVSATPVNVAANADRSGVIAAVKNFASAYNSMVSFIADQTKYDPVSKNGGVLQGDSAATNLQTKLRAMVGATSGASSAFPRLTDIGLEVQRDGTLKVNDAKLTAAANNLPELKKAFSNSDLANAGNSGFARRYADLATQALGVDGTITTRTAGLRTLINKNGDEQTKLNDRVDAFQARLVSQYTALDSNVAKLNSLSAYVTQQVAIWSKSSA